MNKLRERFQNGKKINGTLVSLTDPCLCEIMGNLGYDCVWVDMEHTYMSNKEVLCHLNAARSANIPAIVRLPQNDLTVTKQVLEMDPDGIVFPMSRSAEEVRSLIDMTLYPPNGTRGFGPLRAIGYGTIDAKEYVREKSLELCRFVQIESVELIDELEEAAQIPYVDGFIFGPNDLSGSLGEFLDVFGDTTIAQIKRAIEILRKNGKIIGLAGGMDAEAIKFWSQFDFDMIFAGADWCFVCDAGRRTLDVMKKYCK